MGLWTTAALVCLAAGGWCTQDLIAQEPDTKALLQTMLNNEQNATAHRGYYFYLSEERSDRTGQHLWVEKVVETPQGRVRLLQAEDGQALSPDRVSQERARLDNDAAHPDDFAKREAAGANDEAHAKQMLQLLPKAFLFDPPQIDGTSIRLVYRPNPDYQPQSMEERVLRGMHGTVVIDRQMVRLREVDGQLDNDVSLGFGPFAIVKAGSNFDTLREHVDGSDWKTEKTHTDISGRALMLKSLGRKGDLKRSGYHKVGDHLSVAEAAAMLER